MKRSFKIKLSWIVMACLVIAGILAGMCVFSYRGRINTKISQYKGSQYLASDEVRDDIMTAQEFIPKESYLEAIGLRLLTNPAEDNAAGLYLTLVDYNGEVIANVSTLLSMMPMDDYYYFYTNIEVVPGKAYHILLQTADCQEQYPTLMSYDSTKGKVKENGYYTFDGEIVGDNCLAVSYKYQVPVSRALILIFLLAVLVGTAGMICLVTYCLNKTNKNRTFEIGYDTLKRITPAFENKQIWVLAGVVFGFGMVYLSLCFNNNIWTDEAFTIDLLKHCDTVKEVCLFTAGDVHPPLYYIILLPFKNLFGINLLMFKVLSIIPMLLTMGLGAYYVCKHFGFKTALLYILLLGTIPVTMEYAVQVRMYSWALLFVTVCGLAAYDAYLTNRKRSYVVMGLAGVACAYTQYFTFASALWIYGFLFVFILVCKKKRDRFTALISWLIMCVGSALIYLPWLKYMLKQMKGVSHSYWIPPITKEVVRSYADSFFESDLPYSALIYQTIIVISIVCAVVMFVTSCRKKDVKQRNEILALSMGVAVLCMTVITGIVLSKLIRPIFIIRYAIPCIGLLSMFLAYVLSRIGKKIYVVLVLFCLCMGVVDYKSEYYVEYKSTRVHEMDAFFDTYLGDNDYVIYNYKLFDFIYQYYFDEEILVYVEDMDWSLDFDNVWFLDTAYNPAIAAADMEKYGLDITFVGNYSIEHNSFAIYQIRK